MNEINPSFIEIKKILESLIEDAQLEMPDIIEASEDDPCDTTDLFEIRIKDVGESPGYHARHVFAHWICDKHSDSDSETQDKIADYIAEQIAWNE